MATLWISASHAGLAASPEDPPAPWVQLGGADFAGWKGLTIAGDASATWKVPGEAAFRFPD